MTDQSAHNIFLFAIFPYLALFIFVFVSIRRYISRPFTYSSLSTQFLENRRQFWGIIPFHYGIITLFFGHLAAFLVPSHVLAWNGVTWRLYILEITALIFGLLTLVGLIQLIFRRIGDHKVFRTTSAADWVLYALLLIQIFAGVYIAVFYRWGSSWFAAVLTPYLWSIFKLNPDLSSLSGLPFMVKLHIVNAFLILAIFPFGRLVHLLVVPNPYLWRRTQVHRWYRNPNSAQDALTSNNR